MKKTIILMLVLTFSLPLAAQTPLKDSTVQPVYRVILKNNVDKNRCVRVYSKVFSVSLDEAHKVIYGGTPILLYEGTSLGEYSRVKLAFEDAGLAVVGEIKKISQTGIKDKPAPQKK